MFSEILPKASILAEQRAFAFNYAVPGSFQDVPKRSRLHPTRAQSASGCLCPSNVILFSTPVRLSVSRRTDDHKPERRPFTDVLIHHGQYFRTVPSTSMVPAATSSVPTSRPNKLTCLTWYPPQALSRNDENHRQTSLLARGHSIEAHCGPERTFVASQHHAAKAGRIC